MRCRSSRPGSARKAGIGWRYRGSTCTTPRRGCSRRYRSRASRSDTLRQTCWRTSAPDRCPRAACQLSPSSTSPTTSGGVLSRRSPLALRPSTRRRYRPGSGGIPTLVVTLPTMWSLSRGRRARRAAAAACTRITRIWCRRWRCRRGAALLRRGSRRRSRFRSRSTRLRAHQCTHGSIVVHRVPVPRRKRGIGVHPDVPKHLVVPPILPDNAPNVVVALVSLAAKGYLHISRSPDGVYRARQRPKAEVALAPEERAVAEGLFAAWHEVSLDKNNSVTITKAKVACERALRRSPARRSFRTNEGFVLAGWLIADRRVLADAG